MSIKSATKENIVDDDNYSEMIDIEKGSNGSNGKMSIEKSDDKVESENSLSITDLYKPEKSNSHFIDKLSMELNTIKSKTYSIEREIPERTEMFFSNSPMTMSICSSRYNSEIESDLGENNSQDSKRRGFQKLTYADVEKSLNRHYTRELQLSSEMDILLTYLKGQRHIFHQSSRITSQKFNYLMFPTIFITGSMTVLAPFMDSVGWSEWALSVLNALCTVLIVVNNFMKFQAVSAIYLTISNQFDKLAISVEMSRNQFLYLENHNEKNALILEKMRDTEKRIMDIQNNYNDIIIPYEVQLMNPIISNINIFSFIKKIEHHKKTLIIKYKDVKNEIRYIMYRWEKEQHYDVSIDNRKKDDLLKMQKLLEKKEDIKTQLIQNSNNNVYVYIDNLFVREIHHSEHYYTYHSAGMYMLLRPKPLERLKYGNVVVDDYLNFIFTK